MALNMRLVTNISAISRNGPSDVITKFIESNKHLSETINTKKAKARVTELYRQHLEKETNIECYSDCLVYTSIDWISENPDGYDGHFKYIIFTYRMPTGKNMCFKYMF